MQCSSGFSARGGAAAPTAPPGYATVPFGGTITGKLFILNVLLSRLVECQTTRQEKQYFLMCLSQNVTVGATTSLQLRATAGSDQVVVFRELESQYTRRLDRKRCKQRCTTGRPVNSDNRCSRKRMQQSKKT